MVRPPSAALAASAVAALTFVAPHALAHEGDIGVRVEGGAITTWLVGEVGDPPAEGFLYPERVFGADLVFDAGFGLPTIDEPGFASFDEPALHGRALRFDIAAPLRVWSGGLDGDFGALSPVRLGVGSDELDLDFILTPDTETVVPGHTLVFPGDFDFHFDLRLQGDAQGIYLLAMQIANPGGPLGTSDTVYIVLNYGLDEAEHDAAIEYVVERVVPAPGTGLLAFAGLAFARRRR